MDIVLVSILAHAESGDLRPLADHIEGGGNLDDATREFVAAYLRGEIKHVRGNKRTWAQVQKESRVIRELHMIAFQMLLNEQENLSERQVIETYLNRHAEDTKPLNDNTLRGYVKKFKKRTNGTIVPTG